MVAKFLDLNKQWSQIWLKKKLACTMYDYNSCVIALKKKTVAYTFHPSFDNANGRFCQERLLKSSNFVTIVT